MIPFIPWKLQNICEWQRIIGLWFFVKSKLKQSHIFYYFILLIWKGHIAHHPSVISSRRIKHYSPLTWRPQRGWQRETGRWLRRGWWMRRDRPGQSFSCSCSAIPPGQLNWSSLLIKYFIKHPNLMIDQSSIPIDQWINWANAYIKHICMQLSNRSAWQAFY